MFYLKVWLWSCFPFGFLVSVRGVYYSVYLDYLFCVFGLLILYSDFWGLVGFYYDF